MNKKLDYDTAQTKRAIARAKEEGKILDASHGHVTRSVIITDSGHVILSGLQQPIRKVDELYEN